MLVEEYDRDKNVEQAIQRCKTRVEAIGEEVEGGSRARNDGDEDKEEEAIRGAPVQGRELESGSLETATQPTQDSQAANLASASELLGASASSAPSRNPMEQNQVNQPMELS